MPFNNKKQISSYAFCALFSVLGLFAFSSCDKEEMIMNRWNLQKVTMNGEALNDSTQYNLIPLYTTYHFFLQNSLNVSTFAKGQYTETADGFYQLERKSTLYMRFTILNKRYEIKAKIKKLTKKEMHLEYSNNGNKYLLKLFTN